MSKPSAIRKSTAYGFRSYCSWFSFHSTLLLSPCFSLISSSCWCAIAAGSRPKEGNHAGECRDIWWHQDIKPTRSADRNSCDYWRFGRCPQRVRTVLQASVQTFLFVAFRLFVMFGTRKNQQSNAVTLHRIVIVDTDSNCTNSSLRPFVQFPPDITLIPRSSVMDTTELFENVKIGRRKSGLPSNPSESRKWEKSKCWSVRLISSRK